MEINSKAWSQLKKDIEKHLKNDPLISDVSINYQIREKKVGQLKNILRFNIKIEQWEHQKTI